MIVCLDFDGVLHSYDTPWAGPTVIPDPPVDGAMEFLLELIDDGFTVAVYSARSSHQLGINAMKMWMTKHLAPYMDVTLHEGRMKQSEVPALKRKMAADIVENVVVWPTDKPPAHVTIDDRAITFKGKWPKIVDLRNFKPWNKRD